MGLSDGLFYSRPTVKFRALTMMLALLAVLSAIPLAPKAEAATTLADTINAVLSATRWSDTNYRVQHTGLIFGKISQPNYAVTPENLDETDIQRARLSELDGLGRADVTSILSSYPMTGPFPTTYRSCWLTYHRFAYHIYDWASESAYSNRWNRSTALAKLDSIVGNSAGVDLGYSDWGGAEGNGGRYYDEYMQTVDMFVGLGNVSKAVEVYEWDYASHWNSQWQFWGYKGTNGVECEAGFFAMLVAKLYMANGKNLSHMETIPQDLGYKFLDRRWGSVLWGSHVCTHVGGSKCRLEDTIGAWAAMHMWANRLSMTQKANMIDMILPGGSETKPAWQHLMESPLSIGGNMFTMAIEYGTAPSNEANAVAAKTLFLLGIAPDTGRLAIPLTEERYEDTEDIMPATHFRFDYATQTIRIPVKAGSLKFCFGSQIASANFATNGIYDVRFSSDWNSVQGVNLVAPLSLTYLDIEGSSQPPDTNPPDVAVTEINSRSVASNVSTSIKATVANQGDSTETFSVSLYFNDTSIETQTVSLLNGTSTIIDFTLNTSDFDYGNYSMSAYAWPVQDEIDTADNNMTSWIIVTISGDVDGNFKVNLADLIGIAQAYASKPGDSNWNTNTDIDGNGTVGLSDLVVLAHYYGQGYP